MVGKELADYIKGVVSTYGAITVQAMADFIIALENSKENGKKLSVRAVDIYNDYCKKLGILDEGKE